MPNLITTPFLLQKVLPSLSARIQARDLRLHLLVGGAGALVGAYSYPESTTDVDALILGSGRFEDFREDLQAIALELQLPGDWINPHYSTFTNYLPKDYRKRCVTFFESESLRVDALGPEEIMIMKLMAGRAKDTSHILFLRQQKGVDLAVVDRRLEELKSLYPKEAQRALERFDDLCGECE